AIRSVFTILGKHRRAAWTGLPIIRPIVNWCYRIFARNRLRWFRNHQCESGSCAINPQENSRP
ncbi:MAG: DUF393 domain-containing protein, partial [Phycisphaerales bacterium]|nr:DUF393 domain-containing protein [Phycisphaerales bacterium]